MFRQYIASITLLIQAVAADIEALWLLLLMKSARHGAATLLLLRHRDAKKAAAIAGHIYRFTDIRLRRYATYAAEADVKPPRSTTRQHTG